MKINENMKSLWKSIKIYEIHEHVWDIFVLNKRFVIFYILKDRRLTDLSSKET